MREKLFGEGRFDRAVATGEEIDRWFGGGRLIKKEFLSALTLSPLSVKLGASPI
jgi:hypothetical protein